MIVNKIVEEADALSGMHKRARFEIPAGSWAVSIGESREHWGDREYVQYPDTTFLGFIGEGMGGIISVTPRYCLLKKGWQGEANLTECWKGIYWQDKPFAIIESWEYPIGGRWVHLACQVNEHGITKKLPDLELPPFVSSHAGRHGRQKKPGKWARLTDLARMTGVRPQDLLKKHMQHFNGYDCGLHALVCPSTQDLAQAETVSNIWTIPSQKELLSADMDSVWVRKQLAITVIYLHSLGFHSLPE